MGLIAIMAFELDGKMWVSLQFGSGIIAQPAKLTGQWLQQFAINADTKEFAALQRAVKDHYVWVNV